MYRQWDYTSNPKWLEARKGLLTATDIVGLIAPYEEWQRSLAGAATGNKTFKPESYEKKFKDICRRLWAEKIALTAGQKFDTPEMRRGHCLEPYAVAEVNSWRVHNGLPEMYHWDDMVVKNGRFGCSPDALDVPMPFSPSEKNICDITEINPKHALEIKSFSAPNHMYEYCLSDKWKIDGAYKGCAIINQVAGQIISLGLEDCTVVFYNPQLPKYGIKMFTFDKKDFEAEAVLFPKVVEAYEKAVAEFENLPDCGMQLSFTEQELYDKFNTGGNDVFDTSNASN